MAGRIILCILLCCNLAHAEKEIHNSCSFDIKLEIGLAILKCQSPTPVELIDAMMHINVSGINKIMMNKNNITELHKGTFHFDKLSGIRELNLSNNNLMELPDELFNFTALVKLEKLYLDYNKLVGLKSVQFSCLSGLKYLYLSHNSIQIVESEVFSSIPNSSLQMIDLSFNQINVLPDGLFDTLKHLNRLILLWNRMSKVPKCLITSVYLRQLYLVRNNIIQIPALPDAAVSNLQVIYFTQNNLTRISGDMLMSSSWSALEYLGLGYNKLTCLPQNLFLSRSLGSLQNIFVAHNDLTSLPEGLFNNPVLTNLTSIDFSYNMIEHIPENLFNCNNLGKLKIVDFGMNSIKVLPQKLFGNEVLRNLKEINFSHNKINTIPSEFFKHVENIESLYLKNNSIKQVTTDMFPYKLDHIAGLDLSYNCISSIKEIIPLFLTYRRPPPKLNVNHNLLTVQDTYFISELLYLQGINLHLAFNKINKFEMFSNVNKDVSFHALDNSEIVVEGNKLFSVVNLINVTLGLDLNNIDKLAPKIDLNALGLERLHALIKYFPYNYSCNCDDILNYFKLQETNAFVSVQTQLNGRLGNNFNRLRCGSPTRFSGQYLNEINLQCPVSKCTDEPKCTCTNTISNNSVKINCTRINATKFIDIRVFRVGSFEIYFGFNKLKTFPMAKMTITRSTYVLDLSYNYITVLPSFFFSCYPDIHTLNLVGNLFTTLPSKANWENMNSLRFLEFSGNTFACDCPGLNLQKTLLYLNNRDQPQSRVLDINMIMCNTPEKMRNSVIYTLPESAFDCPFLNLTLILTPTLTLLLIFVTVMFIVYLFRYYIHLCLFVHCGWRFYYDYKDEETMYDVFISYSSKDSDWVINNLVNPLEGLDPPFNLCLHERDFQVGIPICENITRAIEGSKCTIVVVSRNWLESDWCQFEFRVAHCLAVVEKRTRLLVILKEQVPNAEIEGDLQLYMKTFTYLDSANQLFWSRLLNDLPTPYVNEHDRKMKAEADIADNNELI